MESLAGELEAVDVEGQRAWVLATDVEAAGKPAHGSVRLLPQYDGYILGCGPRDRIVPDAARARVPALSEVEGSRMDVGVSKARPAFPCC